jgi:hypothetical protein
MARSPSIDVTSDDQRPAQTGSSSGYGIRSVVPFMTLRNGGAAPLLIEEVPSPGEEGDLLIEWRPRPGNPFHGRLYRDGTRYAFWTSDGGWYLIDPRVPTIGVTDTDDPLRRELRLFGIPISICAFEAGDVSLHASAVEIHGQAVLFGAPSMYGKTTLAATFARAGHRLLTEDTTRCRLGPEPAVYPGPAAVRLRADIARLLDVPGTRQVSARDGRVTLAFDSALRGNGDPVPLRAIFILQASAQGVKLERIPAAQAARDLFALAFRLPTAEARAACFIRIAELAGRVETLELRRTLTLESLDEIVTHVERHLDPAR